MEMLGALGAVSSARPSNRRGVDSAEVDHPGAGHAIAAPGVLAPTDTGAGVAEMVGIVRTFQADERRIVDIARGPQR
jgi:hypothetical protein